MERCIHGIKNPTDCVYCGTMPLEHEIQTLRAKVASAEVLVEALRWAKIALQDAIGKFSKNNDVQHDAIQQIREALATYDKQSEVKHEAT